MKKFLLKSAVFFGTLLIPISVGEIGIRLLGWKEPSIIYQKTSVPELEWAHMPDYEGLLFLTYVKINSQGLRDRWYPYEKPKNTFRIFAVGECSTFGHSVYLHQSFTKQLEYLLNKTPPLKNLAVMK